MKRIIKLILLITCFYVISLIYSYASSENLINNPGFEEDDHWTQIFWVNDSTVSNIERDNSTSIEGDWSINLINIEENDARVFQVIPVEPNQYYKITVHVKTKDIPEGKYGAAVSVLGSLETSEVITNAEDWVEVEFYGYTGKKQKEMSLSFALGGYGNITSGEAWFDKISLVSTEELPEGVISISLEPPNVEEPSKMGMVVYLFIGALLLLVFFIVYMIVIDPSFVKKTLSSFSCKVAKHLNFPRVGLNKSVPNGLIKSGNNSILQLKTIDYIIMGVLTWIYLSIALFNLGELRGPETFFDPIDENPIIINFDKMTYINQLNYYTGVANGHDNRGEFKVFYQDDLGEFQEIGLIQEDETFKWKVLQMGVVTRRILLEPTDIGGSIGEIGLFDIENQLIEINANQVALNRSLSFVPLFDEQELVPLVPSYTNSTYFDEIYFVRTAYEYINDYYIYENTHPVLGKIFIAFGIKLFGNSPFGWRIISVLFGALLIPIIYLFGKICFKNILIPSLMAVMITFDFMHFSQVRMSSIDIYAVVFITLMYFFMYRFFMLDDKTLNMKLGQAYLLLSGVFMALGAGVKWITLYGAIGLAVLYFIKIMMYINYAQVRKVDGKIARAPLTQVHLKEIGTLILCGFIYFIFIPGAIYLIIHLIIVDWNSSMTPFMQIINYQKSMFSYHAGVDATHPFSSKWFEWQLMVKPLWLYTQRFSEDMRSTIVTLGNPAIWWGGIIALVMAAVIALKKKEKAMLVVFIGYLSLLLPWVFISRITFIYHFFAVVPFVILMIGYVFAYLINRFDWGKYVLLIYGVLVIGLFTLFYPVISGAIVKETTIESLKWFSSWIF